MKLNVGDVIEWTDPLSAGTVRRAITAVRDTGYQWRYTDQGDVCASGHRNSFASEDSNDPFFEWGWTIG